MAHFGAHPEAAKGTEHDRPIGWCRLPPQRERGAEDPGGGGRSTMQGAGGAQGPGKGLRGGVEERLGGPRQGCGNGLEIPHFCGISGRRVNKVRL